MDNGAVWTAQREHRGSVDRTRCGQGSPGEPETRPARPGDSLYGDSEETPVGRGVSCAGCPQSPWSCPVCLPRACAGSSLSPPTALLSAWDPHQDHPLPAPGSIFSTAIPPPAGETRKGSRGVIPLVPHSSPQVTPHVPAPSQRPHPETQRPQGPDAHCACLQSMMEEVAGWLSRLGVPLQLRS